MTKFVGLFSRSRAALDTRTKGVDPPENRAAQRLDGAKARNGGVNLLRKFLNHIHITSEPKPKNQDGFLKHALRRGSDHSNVAMLNALVAMKGNAIDCKALTNSQKSRLRHNLEDHGEVLAALNALSRDIEYSDAPGGAFKTFLDDLKASLNDVYKEVGCEAGVELRGNALSRDQLKSALTAAQQLCDGDDVADTIADLIQQQLGVLAKDPSKFPVAKSSPPRYDAVAIFDLKATVKREGNIERSDAEELIRLAMRGSAKDFPKQPFDTYVRNFMNSSAQARYEFLNFVLEAIQIDADDSPADALDRKQYLSSALEHLAASRPFSLEAQGGIISTANGADWPSLEIALQYKRSKDRSVTMQEFERILSPWEKRLLYASLVGRQLQCDVVYEVIDNFRHWGKLAVERDPWQYYADEGVEPRT